MEQCQPQALAGILRELSEHLPVDPITKGSNDPTCPDCGGSGSIAVDSQGIVKVWRGPRLLDGSPDPDRLHLGRWVHPGHRVYIECPCQDAVKRGQEMERMRIFNRLPERLRDCTFGNFIPRKGTEIALAAARKLTESRTGGLVVTGIFGSGKSHLGAAVVNTFAEMLVPCKFVFAGDVLRELRAGIDDNTIDWKLQVFCRGAALVLDDFGAGLGEMPTQWERGQFETIINARYEGATAWMVLTNWGPKDIEELWGGRIADRLFDRHTGKVQHIHMTAGSYRR